MARARGFLEACREAWAYNLFARVIAWAVLLAVLLGMLALSCARAEVPASATGFKREYTRIVRSEWGLDAPVATFAAQIHQESAWDCRAISRAGARGCAQFMPTTAKWIGEVDRRLFAGDLHSPAWAFRAQVVYMRWILARVKGRGECDQMAAALASYNAGLGWVQRAQKAAATHQWLNGAERANPGQAEWAFRESRHYPRRILGELEPRYIKAGWGEGICWS